MKLSVLFFGFLLMMSCDKKSLSEKEILEIINSKDGFQLLELRIDFLYGENFIDSTKAFRKIVRRENLKPIYEADLNNDGKQDYLINLKRKKDNNDEVLIEIYDEDSDNCILILSNEKGYELLNPGKKRVHDIFAAKLISHKNQKLIRLINFKREIDDKDDILEFDTLMLKNNQILEFSKPNKIHNIETITIKKLADMLLE